MRLKTINKWLRRVGLVWTVNLYEDGTGDESKIRIEFGIERASTYDARIPAEGFAVQIHKIDTPELILSAIQPETVAACNEHPPRCLDCDGVVPVESFDAVSFHCRHCDQHVPFCQCEMAFAKTIIPSGPMHRPRSSTRLSGSGGLGQGPVPYLPSSVHCAICGRARPDCKCEGGVSI